MHMNIKKIKAVRTRIFIHMLFCDSLAKINSNRCTNFPCLHNFQYF